MNKKMRVLVTGATGFLGRHIVERLVTEGVEVVALVRRPILLDDWFQENVECVIGDIRNKEALPEALKDVDVVVHAAITFAGDWNNFYKVNGSVKNCFFILHSILKVLGSLNCIQIHSFH